MKKVGLIGLGIMGTGLASQWLQKGYDLTVWNRDISKAASLAEKGAKVATSAADLASQVDVVVTMLRDDAVVLKTLLGSENLTEVARPGTIFIDMSTITPMASIQIAGYMHQKGFAFLEAPVLGSKEAAANALLTVLVGGEAATLEAVRDVLTAVSQNLLHIGQHGAAAVFKLANNQVAAVALVTLGESLKLCESYGLQLSREQILDSLIGTMSRVAGMKKPKIANKEWSTHFALDLMYKDLSQALQAAGEKELPMPLLATAREVFQRARQSGKGGADFAAIADFE